MEAEAGRASGMRTHRLVWVTVAGVLAAMVIAASAQAGSAAETASLPAGELAQREAETAALGTAHAAEHAAMRAAALSDEPPAPEMSAAAVSTDPAMVGRWTPKFGIPGVAVHAVMLHTGKVLYFTGTTQGRAYLLDPLTQTTKAVFPPRIAEREDEPANIFCAGQSLLDDGTVLVMGGTIGRREGLDTIFTFDPVSETWKRQANMHHGRWYPTQVLLADGRTVVMDGLDETGEPNVNQQMESYTRLWDDMDWVQLLLTRGQPGQPPTGGLYPHMFQMPSGRVLVAGPEPTDSWSFSLNSIGALDHWEDYPNPTRHTWGSGVLLPGDANASTRVALIGGVDRASLPDTGTSTPLPGVQTFDEANPAAGWTSAPPLNNGRAHHNTVQLPDRSMVTVGGGYGILNGNRRSGDPAIHRNIELFDPATGQWSLGPAQDELRTYHSTALLLPDGRVMSAGDDGYGGSTNDTVEIYEPPYLFKGPRPTIASAPGSITYGDTFTVETSADTTKAVLMAPAAVTHANDMSQRHVPLQATVGPPGTLTVEAPARPELAPATYYMLFVLNDQGVPSVAKFIQLKHGRFPGYPTLSPPVAPNPPSPDTTVPDTTSPDETSPGETSPRTTSPVGVPPAGATPTTLGAVGGVSVLDSTAPALHILAGTVRNRRVVVEVGCPTEPCATTASGRVLLPGAVQALGLQPASAQVKKGSRARLGLRFSKRAWQLTRRALRAGMRVRIRVTLTARDFAGNVARARRSIRLG
jgi:galactose oxidase-like protein/Kelch motif protein